MTYTKNIMIAVLTVALCGALLYACNEHKQKQQTLKQAKETEQTLSAIVKPTKVYKDSAGIVHIVLPSKANTVKEYSPTQRLAPFIDSVAKALDIKPKQVESVMVVPTETHAAEIAFLQKKIDSLSKLTFYYKDKYLELAVRSGNPKDTADKGVFDFKYNADLTISQYWKRRRFLGIPMGAKVSYTDISSNDPRTTILGVKKYTVTQQQPNWGLRIQATQNYSFISNTVNTGIGARFDLKHLSLYGAYYYNWSLHQWRPVMSMSYDLIRF